MTILAEEMEKSGRLARSLPSCRSIFFPIPGDKLDKLEHGVDLHVSTVSVFSFKRSKFSLHCT